MRSSTFSAAAVAALMLCPMYVPAAAAQGPRGDVQMVLAQRTTGRAVPRDRFQQVYSQGYGSGVREGERDARSRRGGDYRRHNDYRRAGGWGDNRSGEADAFRRGFAQGYVEAYDRALRGARGGSVYPSSPRSGYPSYPGSGYPRSGYPGGYGYAGAERGFDDGYRDGQNAAHRNQRPDPVREKRYRQGDAGYSSRDGSRDQYKMDYRNAYRQGYERGYREGRWR